MGTVLNAEQLQASVDALRPVCCISGRIGTTLAAAQTAEIPLIPGVATISEVQTALQMGFDHLKFFPAEAMGGVKTLKAFSSLFPKCAFVRLAAFHLQTMKATWRCHKCLV